MKALITGGTGFIGSHVTNLLAGDHHAVRFFSRSLEIPEWLKGRDVELFRGDLEKPDSVLNAMEGIDVFYHIGEIRNRTRATSEKNIRLMETIIENLGKKGVKRIVFVSSITVSGIPCCIPADEDTQPEISLEDHYTLYKKRCEERLKTTLDGSEYAIIRPAPVFGPGSRYLGKLIDALDIIGPVGVPFPGDAKNLAPLIHVKDLAKAIYLAGIKPAASGQTFILTDGLRHSWLEFFSSISTNLGRRLRIITIPPLLLRVSAIPFDLFSGIFGITLNLTNYAGYFSRDLYFDNGKARDLLDWQAEYSLIDGVREMVESYRTGRGRSR
ncbi:MAG TPA: NAD-dependent epimerase/dehydratase family protein [Thermodesulfovibrionales bacterium]|nr:NAD-dependent epimerase/dehydratase family protein [Thermodesulfovibrionales bacterium]